MQILETCSVGMSIRKQTAEILGIKWQDPVQWYTPKSFRKFNYFEEWLL